MRLLSLTLHGEYKGLKNQTFDFHNTQGNIIALIGLNGSGKSQLLELIGEIFAFLERAQRVDFKVRTPLGFGFSLTYQLSGTTNHGAGSPGMTCGSPLAVAGGISLPKFKATLDEGSKKPSAFIWRGNSWTEIAIKALELPYVVGYSSGLNENLQRSFMKNAAQYYDVIRVRMNRQKRLDTAKAIGPRAEINQFYLRRYPHIFKRREELEPGAADYYFPEHEISESDTAPSKHIFLDYDHSPLLLIALALVSSQRRDEVLSEATFKHPHRVTLQYDLRNVAFAKDTASDILMLCRIAGENNVKGIGDRTTDEEFDEFELNHKAGLISLNLNDQRVISQLLEISSESPLSLFQRLYRFQQLGVKNWQTEHRKAVSKDNFMGTIKKPLKTKLPLSIEELVISDGNGRKVRLDDLSDGETQLLQALAAGIVFGSEKTLFLFDEPETHLNPSWRTNFHKHLNKALESGQSTQAFITTHSPFMISSLRSDDVMTFERQIDSIQMKPVPQTSRTFGASFDVLIKEHFNLRSLISQTVVEEIRNQLAQGDEQALEWIEQNLGMSPEKAYLVRKLRQ